MPLTITTARLRGQSFVHVTQWSTTGGGPLGPVIPSVSLSLFLSVTLSVCLCAFVCLSLSYSMSLYLSLSLKKNLKIPIFSSGRLCPQRSASAACLLRHHHWD